MKQTVRRLRAYVHLKRALFGKIALELVVVFVGVTAAFALENARHDAEEAAYRQTVVAALGQTFGNVGSHGGDISARIDAELATFDAAVARGEQPRLPVYREEGGEGPPTQIWDGLMSTGALRALEPEMVWRLAAVYNELDSVGDRYRRYNAITEARVFGLDPDHAGAWEDGRLKPEFRAYVQQLRELAVANDRVNRNASALQQDLERDYPTR